MSSINLKNVLNIMIDAALKASRRIIRDFGELEKLQVSKKGLNDFVTKSDLKSEEIIISILSEFAPEFKILSEERGHIMASKNAKNSEKSYRFIVDPLDGTINFMHSIPFFAVSIALEETDLQTGEREIVAGVTSLPIMQEIYFASKGQGAWVEKIGYGVAISGKQRIRVSARNNIMTSLNAVGSIEMADELSQNRFVAMIKSRNHMRHLGSSAISLAYLASGKLDLYFSHATNLWDIAAGVILIKEAGGVVLDFKGEKFTFTKGKNTIKNDLVTTNMAFLKELRKTSFFD